MVQIIMHHNAHLYKDTLRSMYEMRYRVAVGEWGWNIPGVPAGFDKDRFDTNDTIYFVCLDPTERKVLACARLNPTMKPHLLSDVFANRCVTGDVPRAAEVYELSRYIVDHGAMTQVQQKAVRGRIVSAVNKFCLEAGVTHVTFLSYMSSYARTIKYWETRPLGPPCYFEEDNAEYIAAISAMTHAGLDNLRHGFDLKDDEPFVSSRLSWSDNAAIKSVQQAREKKQTAA